MKYKVTAFLVLALVAGAVAPHFGWRDGHPAAAAMGQSTSALRPAASDSMSVSLESKLLPNSAPLFGISNIFFKAPGTTAILCPENWQQVQIADIVEGGRFRPVYAVQYKDASGAVQFAVDADSDKDLTNEKPLAFQREGDSLFADIRVRLVEKNGTSATSPVIYQIIRAEKWVYARVREYRTGTLRIGGLSHNVVLRPRSRSKPLFGLADTLLFVDENRDGEMSQAEEVLLSQPFIVGGKKLEAVSLDAAGSRLVLRPSLAETAVAIGFRAPNAGGPDLDGRRHALQDMKGKVVLLEFWSVNCPFADTIRPLINRIADRFDAADFAALSIAREPDAAVLRAYLKANPKSSVVLLRNEEAWKTFNPEGATPVCFLIDRDGVIRLRAVGAAAVKTMEDAVAGLLK